MAPPRPASSNHAVDVHAVGVVIDTTPTAVTRMLDAAERGRVVEALHRARRSCAVCLDAAERRDHTLVTCVAKLTAIQRSA